MSNEDISNEHLANVCYLKLIGLNGGRGRFNAVRQGLKTFDEVTLRELNQLLLSAESERVSKSDRYKYYR